MAHGWGPVLRSLEQALAGPPDDDLLARFIDQRDESAFEALVRKHGPLVFGVCRRQLRHDQDAEDVFQATFLVLARKASSVRRRASLSCWLHGVALRLARKARASQVRRPRPLTGTDDVMAPAAVEDWVRHDLRRVLDEEIARLPRHYREPLVLCHLQGRTNEEAARSLGCPRGTIQSRLSRARAYLGRRLLRRGIGPDATLTIALPALPAPLATATARAALGHTASAHVAALAIQGGLPMLTIRRKISLFVLLALLLVGAGATSVAERAAPPATIESPRPAPLNEEAPLPEPTAVRKPDQPKKETRLEAVLRAWAKAQDAASVGERRFVQTELDKVFGEKSVFTGQARWRKRDLVRIDRLAKGKPTATFLVTDKATHLYNFGNKTETVWPRKDQLKSPFAEALRKAFVEGPIEMCLGPDAHTLAVRYNVSLAKEDRWYVYLDVRPKKPEDRGNFQRMRIVLLREGHTLRQLWVEHANGNQMTTDYQPTKTAPENLTPEAILRGLPRGWKRVDMGELMRQMKEN